MVPLELVLYDITPGTGPFSEFKRYRFTPDIDSLGLPLIWCNNLFCWLFSSFFTKVSGLPLAEELNICLIRSAPLFCFVAGTPTYSSSSELKGTHFNPSSEILMRFVSQAAVRAGFRNVGFLFSALCQDTWAPLLSFSPVTRVDQEDLARVRSHQYIEI